MFHQSVGSDMHRHNQSIIGEEKREIAENLETIEEREKSRVMTLADEQTGRG